MDFCFENPLNVGVRLSVSPALVKMVGANAPCDLEKEKQRLPLLQGVTESCGRFLC